MKRSEIKKRTDEELRELFREAAEERGRAFDNNNVRLANKACDLEMLILKELKGREPLSSRTLLSLLDSPDSWVRLDAATGCLFLVPQEALPALERIYQDEEPGMRKAIAGMTLSQWWKGKLKFPD